MADGSLPQHSPLDRAIPWFAGWANRYYKMVLQDLADSDRSVTQDGRTHYFRRAEKKFAEWGDRALPAYESVGRAFGHWITQTRPNLQGVLPGEAYRRAVDWEHSQLDQKEYREARAKLQDKSFGRVLLRFPNGEQLREISQILFRALTNFEAYADE